MKFWQILGLVSLVWAGLFLPFLGTGEIRGEEARRILPARNMLTSGDLVVPTHGGEVYNRKPPLIYWNIAAVFAISGVQNDWMARLPSVLWILAFALVATVALRGKFGAWRAGSVALIFLTAIGVLDKGRMAEIEAMYVAQTGIAFVLWAAWWSSGRNWLAWTVPWLILGLGLLAKGPVHLLFFYPVVIAALWRAKLMRELFHPAHWLGVLLMLGVFLPWVLLNLSRVDSVDQSSGVWMQQITERFRLSGFNFGKWIVQPLQLVKDFLPWSIPLIWAWWVTRKRPVNVGDRWGCVIFGCRVAIFVGLGILMLSPEMLPRYIMPVFPIASVLLVELLGRLDQQQAESLSKWWRMGLRVMASVLIVAALFSIWAIPQFTQAEVSWVGVAFAIFGGGLAILMIRREPLVVTSLVFVAGLIFAFSYLTQISSQSERYRPVAAEVEALVPDSGELLAIYDPGDLRFLFYLDRPYVEAARVARLRELAEIPRYFMIQESDFAEEKIQKYLVPFEVNLVGNVTAGRHRSKPTEWQIWRLDAKG